MYVLQFGVRRCIKRTHQLVFWLRVCCELPGLLHVLWGALGASQLLTHACYLHSLGAV
jgi:hypothetical protein